jgi:diaminohydroxyphosphoribosylaminopyrimidine deaminase/5-amino-6-(5-phosphoribosylamino)uracil reductase
MEFAFARFRSGSNVSAVFEDDTSFMQRALELAERGRGAVEPNPLVGAVVVRDRTIVGEGWHAHFGGPHAERVALEAAGQAARGSTLYSTLEPCCHTGKTPPCTNAIVTAGIARVVAAMRDPFPDVAGRGISSLKAAGLAVAMGVESERARNLNRPYLTLVTSGRPYVHAKWAMTLDGKIAPASGQSKWISSQESRQMVHELRARMDAVIVGAGTVRNDDPLLTARPPGPRIAKRIVLSSTGELPQGCRLLQSLDQAPLIVATLAGRGTDLRGCEVIELPEDDGRPSVAGLVRELGRRRMTNVLLEGGARLFGSFHDRALLDELHVFIAPRLLGGASALSPIAGAGLPDLNSGRRPMIACRFADCGPDIYINARIDLEQPAISHAEPA